VAGILKGNDKHSIRLVNHGAALPLASIDIQSEYIGLRLASDGKSASASKTTTKAANPARSKRKK
jgi:hypothetical protein